MRTFELFLLGLAAANLEEILAVNIYDVILLCTSCATMGIWSCRTLKLLTMLVETASNPHHSPHQHPPLPEAQRCQQQAEPANLPGQHQVSVDCKWDFNDLPCSTEQPHFCLEH